MIHLSTLGYLDINNFFSSAIVKFSMLMTTNLDRVAGLNALVQTYLSLGLAVAKIRQFSCGIITSQSFSASNKFPSTLSTDSVSAWIVNRTSGNAALISSKRIQCQFFSADSSGPSCRLVSPPSSTYLPSSSSLPVCQLRLIRVNVLP